MECVCGVCVCVCACVCVVLYYSISHTIYYAYSTLVLPQQSQQITVTLPSLTQISTKLSVKRAMLTGLHELAIQWHSPNKMHKLLC